MCPPHSHTLTLTHSSTSHTTPERHSFMIAQARHLGRGTRRHHCPLCPAAPTGLVRLPEPDLPLCSPPPTPMHSGWAPWEQAPVQTSD